MSVLNEATARNLRRKSAYVDEVELSHDGTPMPSWIDLSLTELCNRSAGSRRPCVFCPRIDPGFYPNQALHMSLELVRKIAADLERIDYGGSVVLCGFGEPMLHPRFYELVSLLAGKAWRLELVTNGDRLTVAAVQQLRDKIDCFVVSMYDGPDQVARFHDVFRQGDPLGWQRHMDLIAARGNGSPAFVLRDRWHTEADAFGLKLTNRAGTVDAGQQGPALPGRPCNYLAYQLTIDWNGDALLCPQDWHKKVKFGNLGNQTVMEVWTSPAIHKRRMQLLRGDRKHSPCHGCNTDGCLHGFNHAPIWEERAQRSASSDTGARRREPAGENA